MAEAPTAEEAFGGAAPTISGLAPTADEAFGDVQEGSLLHRFAVGQYQAEERIYQAFKGTAARAFGDESITSGEMFGLNEKTYEGLRKSGFWNDYAKGQNDVRKQIYENVFRSTVGTLGTTIRAGEAAIAAPIGAFGQFLQEIGVMKKEDVEAAAADPGIMMATMGASAEYAMVQARRAANLKTAIPKARANGVLNEGEAGYFEAKPITPEHAQARVEAAKEAGISPPVPEPVAPDVHALARRIDPPTFEKYDALEAEKIAHRQAIYDAAVASENLPEAVAAQTEINTILDKLKERGWNPTQKTAERLTEVQERLSAILEKGTPAMVRAREALNEADLAQSALVPDIQAAYRQAHEMMPVETKVADTVQAASDAPLPVTERAVTPQVAEKVAEGTDETVATKTGGRTTGSIRTLEGTGPLRTRTLSEGIEAKAIEEKLTQSFGDLPEYHQLSMADQARRAAEFVAKSPDEAFQVAMGRKSAPRGLSPASVLVVVEKELRAASDVEGLRQLATEGGLSRVATDAGRFIRILGERDPTSPMGAISAVQEARRAALETKNAAALKDAAKEIKAQIKRSAPTRDAWGDFITSITCAE